MKDLVSDVILSDTNFKKWQPGWWHTNSTVLDSNNAKVME